MTRLLLSFLCLGLAVTPAWAEADRPEDAARHVIESQLDAFARNDADAAYRYAAPDIQAMFPDSLEFLSMVAHRYPAVYRHKRVEFGDAAEKDGHVAESVLFTDGDGRLWQAIYKLEKGPDGQWLISGCVLSESGQTGL
jgi:hypothetical protein